jgi:hypothetical protein
MWIANNPIDGPGESIVREATATSEFPQCSVFEEVDGLDIVGYQTV